MQNTIYICVTTAVVLALAGAASAASYDGTLLVGNPTTPFPGGATELLTPCDTDSALNGSDGQWFDISGDAGTSFTLTMDPTLDADVYFYDGDCSFIDYYGGAQHLLNTTESGARPANAAYAIVDAFSGAGSFSLTLA